MILAPTRNRRLAFVNCNRLNVPVIFPVAVIRGLLYDCVMSMMLTATYSILDRVQDGRFRLKIKMFVLHPHER